MALNAQREEAGSQNLLRGLTLIPAQRFRRARRSRPEWVTYHFPPKYEISPDKTDKSCSLVSFLRDCTDGGGSFPQIFRAKRTFVDVAFIVFASTCTYMYNIFYVYIMTNVKSESNCRGKIYVLIADPSIRRASRRITSAPKALLLRPELAAARSTSRFSCSER